MKKILKKEYILIYASIAVFVYALILNIFFPLPKTKKYNSSSDTGIKADFKAAVSKFVSDDVSGLSFGYLLGEKSELPPGVEEKMKGVGLAHIIVVSGTHLSIIVMSLRKVFGKISRFSALYFSIFLLMLYVIMIGFSPSVIRASFVAVLSLFTWYFGREQRVFRTIILTLGFCLAVNPYFLTNVSFQLSMLAYSGVVVILPILIRYFYGRAGPGFIGSTILSSLSAIIACLPIQLYYFGSLNLISIFANLLILPTISITMGVSFFTGVLSLLNIDFLAMGFGKITEAILSYHIKVISELYDKSEFMFEFTKNNPVFLSLYVVIIALIIVSIHQNIKVSKGDTSDHDDAFIRFDKRKDVISESIERNEISNAPSTKRNEE
jgi:competence protein ComEC